MNILEHMQALMEDLASSSEAVNTSVQVEEHRWMLSVIDSQLLIEAELDEKSGFLSLTTQFRPPDPDKLEITMEAMLGLNLLAGKAGGLRMALDEAWFPIQIMDLPVANLELNSLQAACEFFATRAVLWHAVLAAGGIADAEQSSEVMEKISSAAMLQNSGVIRA